METYLYPCNIFQFRKTSVIVFVISCGQPFFACNLLFVCVCTYIFICLYVCIFLFKSTTDYQTVCLKGPLNVPIRKLAKKAYTKVLHFMRHLPNYSLLLYSIELLGKNCLFFIITNSRLKFRPKRTVLLCLIASIKDRLLKKFCLCFFHLSSVKSVSIKVFK